MSKPQDRQGTTIPPFLTKTGAILGCFRQVRHNLGALKCARLFNIAHSEEIDSASLKGSI